MRIGLVSLFVFFSVVAAAAAMSVMGSGCGGSDPYCGDGNVDTNQGEACDDGNDDQTDFCRNCQVFLPATTTVQWEFNKNAAPGFTGDSCIDLGVFEVEVEVVGAVTETLSEGCSLRQVVFSELPAGQYLARVRPLDINGDMLIDAPVEQTLSIAGNTNQEFEVVIPPEAWTGTYTGTFYFRMQFGGQDCATAVPPVVDHIMTLSQDGQPVSIQTTDGHPLDGTASGTCVSFLDEFPQSALTVPFGPATFRVVGLDDVGTPQFDEEFDTFIGAGVSNPEFEFDVRSLNPDAGVPDAGVPDAGVPAVDGGL